MTTLTEVSEYVANLYIQEGRLTYQQWAKIKQGSLLVSLGIILVVLVPAVLMLVWGLNW